MIRHPPCWGCEGYSFVSIATRDVMPATPAKLASASVIPIVEHRSWGYWTMGGGWRRSGVSARSMCLLSLFAMGDGD